MRSTPTLTPAHVDIPTGPRAQVFYGPIQLNVAMPIPHALLLAYIAMHLLIHPLLTAQTGASEFDNAMGMPEKVHSICIGHTVGSSSKDGSLQNYSRHTGQTADDILRSALMIHGCGRRRWESFIDPKLVDVVIDHLARNGIMHADDEMLLQQQTHGHPAGSFCGGQTRSVEVP